MYQRKAEKVRYKAYINLELALKNQNVLRANLPLASDQCVIQTLLLIHFQLKRQNFHFDFSMCVHGGRLQSPDLCAACLDAALLHLIL